MNSAPTARVFLRRGRSARAGAGFTLLEVMLVVGIMGLVLAMGIPSIVRTLQREPLQQAVNDVVEALSHARALAILQGRPAHMVLDGDGHLTAVLASPGGPAAAGGGAVTAEGGNSIPAGVIFRARLGQDIRVTFMGVNLVPINLDEASEVRVRFHANGTSDDFTIVLEDGRGVRTIELDPITGLTQVTMNR